MKKISKYQIQLLYTPQKLVEARGKVNERTCSSDVENSSNNFEPDLFKKVHTVLLRVYHFTTKAFGDLNPLGADLVNNSQDKVRSIQTKLLAG